MTTLSIMQPYLFPYLGYFELIACADQFVLYDDVNFIKRGWINRNQILLQNREHRFTFPVGQISQNVPINAHHLSDPDGRYRAEFLKTLQSAYKKAPYFPEIFPVLESAISYPETQLNLYIENGLLKICDYIGIKTPFARSSEIPGHSHLHGQDKILAICESRAATTYVNAIGGKTLYDRETFKSRGIDLKFLSPRPFIYPQYTEPFVPSLSIIDVLMFNPTTRVQKYLANSQFE